MCDPGNVTYKELEVNEYLFKEYMLKYIQCINKYKEFTIKLPIIISKLKNYQIEFIIKDMYDKITRNIEELKSLNKESIITTEIILKINELHKLTIDFELFALHFIFQE